MKIIKNKTDYDLFPKEQADKIKLIDQEIIRTGKSIVTEEEVTTINGDNVLYLSHKRTLRNKQQQIMVL